MNPTRAENSAFTTWEAEGESLESVEARIHDGVPIGQLNARAHGYLDTFERCFPNTLPRRGSVVLEIGSGLAYVMQAAFERYRPSRLIGLDIAQGMIAHARSRLARDRITDPVLDFLHYDGITIPMPDKTVDHVYSVAALQHAPRPFCFRALIEAYRLLRPGGWAWIHLLAYSHLHAHASPGVFAQEVERQVRGAVGHWHHYYTKEELEIVARVGLGAREIVVHENCGSLWLAFRCA